MLNPPQPFW